MLFFNAIFWPLHKFIGNCILMSQARTGPYFGNWSLSTRTVDIWLVRMWQAQSKIHATPCNKILIPVWFYFFQRMEMISFSISSFSVMALPDSSFCCSPIIVTEIVWNLNLYWLFCWQLHPFLYRVTASLCPATFGFHLLSLLSL